MDSMLANAWHALMREHAGKVVVLEQGVVKVVGHALAEVAAYLTHKSTVVVIPKAADDHVSARDILGIGWDLLAHRERLAEDTAALARKMGVDPDTVHRIAPVAEEAAIVAGEVAGLVVPDARAAALLQQGAQETAQAIAAIDQATRDAFEIVMSAHGGVLVPGTPNIYRLPDGQSYSLLDFARGRAVPLPPEPAFEDGHAPMVPAHAPFQALPRDSVMEPELPVLTTPPPVKLAPAQPTGGGREMLSLPDGRVVPAPGQTSSPPVDPFAAILGGPVDGSGSGPSSG